MPELYILTYGTEEAQLYYLRRSAGLSGVKVINVATGKKWDNYQDKLFGVRDWIQQHGPFGEGDLIMFVDAYDVLLCGGIEDMRAAYEEYGSPELLLATEKNCFPVPDIADDYPVVESEYRFINSGGYIGTAAGILKMINWMEESEVAGICVGMGDQGYVIRYYFEGGADIKLDTKCLLFNCMYQVAWDKFLKFEKGKWVNLETMTKPSVLHFNGGSYLTKNNSNIMGRMVEIMELGRDAGLEGFQPLD